MALTKRSRLRSLRSAKGVALTVRRTMNRLKIRDASVVYGWENLQKALVSRNGDDILKELSTFLRASELVVHELFGSGMRRGIFQEIDVIIEKHIDSLKGVVRAATKMGESPEQLKALKERVEGAVNKEIDHAGKLAEYGLQIESRTRAGGDTFHIEDEGSLLNDLVALAREIRGEVKKGEKDEQGIERVISGKIKLDKITPEEIVGLTEKLAGDLAAEFKDDRKEIQYTYIILAANIERLTGLKKKIREISEKGFKKSKAEDSLRQIDVLLRDINEGLRKREEDLRIIISDAEHAKQAT